MVDFNVVTMFFQELGVFVQMKLLSFDQVEKLLHRHIMRMWEMLKPLIEQVREIMKDPHLGQGWENLYKEMKRREQQK